MSSPDSAFCHHHSVTPAQKTITLSSQEAPICSAQQDMSRGFVFLFRKKPNQIKTLRQIKDPEKNPNNNKECVLDCSYFLPSLSRKLVFLPFFHSPIPTIGSPSKTSRGSPSLSSRQTLLGLLMHCAAGPIPHLGSRRSFRRRTGNLLQSHYIVCYHLVLTSPIPADQQPHRAPSTTDILRPHEKLQRVLS